MYSDVVLILEETEHVCEENKLHGTAMDSRVYKDKHNGRWYLSLDCNLTSDKINYCPYCGKPLY